MCEFHQIAEKIKNSDAIYMEGDRYFIREKARQEHF